MQMPIVVLLLALPALAAAAPAPSVVLTRDGKPRAGIYVAPGGSASMNRGAEEVQHHIQLMSGAKLPIRRPEAGWGEFERADKCAVVLADDAIVARREHRVRLAPGEFVIRFRLPNTKHPAPHADVPVIEIVGDAQTGVLNGCYALLEDILGCRWYTPTVTIIPSERTITVPAVRVRQRPAFAYREVYYAEAMDPGFAARQRLNGNASIVRDGKMTSEQHRGWGYWCHSFFSIVPPQTHFRDHPEYFALVNGKRVDNTQLCLTNPDVLRLTVEHLRAKIRERTDLRYWSVSQNDTGGNCQCPTCKAIDDREGTPMGSLLEFVNKVAAEFPDRIVSTLSYQYTRRPPKTLKPAPNVHIMLCSIECNRSRPIGEDPSSASFREDVQRWAQLTDNVFVWDYVIQFSNLVSPFPNLRVLQPNMRFLAANHARGMFAQGNREVRGEFADLRSYLLAKLEWNPDGNVDALIDDFLGGVYGPAAKPLRRYIDQMHEALAESGAGLSIFGSPQDGAKGYLSEANLNAYRALFDEAEKLVANRPDLLERVRIARMPIQYAQLQLRYGSPEERRAVADRLFETAERAGLRQFTEWGMPVAEYRAKVQADLGAEAHP